MISGCTAPAILYSDTVSPLCLDARGTSLGTLDARGDTKRISIPSTNVDFTAEWSSRAIGDVARKQGIDTVHGCDMHRISVLLGIWSQQEVIVYGAKNSEERSERKELSTTSGTTAKD
jgi:hypothetical protein